MITMTIRVQEDLWLRLRRLAEEERTRGRAAVGHVAVRLIIEGLDRRGQRVGVAPQREQARAEDRQWR